MAKIPGVKHAKADKDIASSLKDLHRANVAELSGIDGEIDAITEQLKDFEKKYNEAMTVMVQARKSLKERKKFLTEQVEKEKGVLGE